MKRKESKSTNRKIKEKERFVPSFLSFFLYGRQEKTYKAIDVFSSFSVLSEGKAVTGASRSQTVEKRFVIDGGSGGKPDRQTHSHTK